MSELRELNNVSLPFALDDRKNYIYIQDAKRNNTYYCPCCGKELITAAIDEDKEYKVPAYYRHKPNEKCDAESLSHWVYKIWLFDKGCQFYVNDGINKKLYTVESVDIEKTYYTDFGNYRPDITIITTSDKMFFFEINFSNPKRSDDYYCKWWELNNDVIEVDVMKLQKESFNNRIPTFRLIYSDGICYDSKYNRKDVFAGIANDINIRKEEIKRQDMLNYKTVWEKLDWFWNEIKKYKAMKSTMDDVLNSFKCVPYEEMELCFNIVKRVSCINNNQGFRDIINQNFNDQINNLINKYNKMINKMAIFSIKKDAYYKMVWNINCETIDSVGIMMKSIHKIESELTWRKHYFPYSLYLEFENIIINYYDSLLIHFSIVNKINQCIRESANDKDYEYIKTKNNYPYFTSKLLDSENYIEKYKNDVLCCIRDRIYNENKCKIEDTINNFNFGNDRYEYEYSVCKNEEMQITSISFTLYSTRYKDILSKKIKICNNIMETEDINKFLNSTPKIRLKILKNFIVDIKQDDMINTKFAVTLSDIKQKIKSRCNYLYFDYNCPDIYTAKFRISIRINYGTGWHKNYKYYCGKYIELKNNIINEMDINTLYEDDLYDFILDKLIESKDIALKKFNKLDGIKSESRFIFTKEETNAKTNII